MSSNTAVYLMKMIFVLLVFVLAASRIRSEEQCGDELTCLQTNQLLLEKQLIVMQEQFQQIQLMHEADRKIMAQQLEFAAKQVSATHDSVSFWHTFSSGVISSALPIVLCLLVALCLTVYRKLVPTVQQFRSAWIQREADRMMDAHRLNEVAKVFARLSQPSDQSDAHELRDMPSGSSPPCVVTV